MEAQRDVLRCMRSSSKRFWHDALATKERKGEEAVITNRCKTATIRKLNNMYVLEAKRLLPICVKNRSAMHCIMSEFDISLVGW